MSKFWHKIYQNFDIKYIKILTWNVSNFDIKYAKFWHKTYQNFDNQYEGKVNFDDINATTFDLKNISLLMKGPGLFDYCEAQLQKSKNISVSLTNCIDPYYLLPLMFKSSKKINFCRALWNDKEKKM